jgi:hypothetical protein
MNIERIYSVEEVVYNEPEGERRSGEVMVEMGYKGDSGAIVFGIILLTKAIDGLDRPLKIFDADSALEKYNGITIPYCVPSSIDFHFHVKDGGAECQYVNSGQCKFTSNAIQARILFDTVLSPRGFKATWTELEVLYKEKFHKEEI